MKTSVIFYADRNIGEYKLNIYKHINKYFQNNLDKYDPGTRSLNGPFNLPYSPSDFLPNISGPKPSK